ncbi:MAG TPA: helix-turn-helix domain-containing protein [Acidimicrobiales bacterium]|nr:helix-turn-helix domain-containing protein [Acidimicrobiales bacterium]
MRRASEGERLLLTVVEAAAMLGVGRTKAYELIAGGHLQVVHIGRAARVPVAAVHRYVEALVSPPRRRMSTAARQRAASQPPLPFADPPKD